MKITSLMSLFGGVFLLALTACESGPKITKAEVESFVDTHLASQLGGQEDAVSAYNATLSDELVGWANASWPSTPSVYDKANTKADWFYEDSITHEIHDILILGSDAHVMGSAKWYAGGVETFGNNFSGIVGRENGQLVWKRFMGVWTNTLAKDFLWPSTEAEGGLSMYNRMRNAMTNLDNEVAMALSDSLVAMDENWATAHLGQLHYHWLNDDEAKLKAVYDEAMSKLEGASIAERHVIEAYNPKKGADNREHLRMALIHAPNDPVIRVWYAFGEKDYDRAIDILKKGLDRMPDHCGLNNMIAYKYMYEGDMENAEKHFTLNLKSNPDVANVHDSYGDFLMEKGDKNAAKAAYMKAYDLDNTGFAVSKEKADKI